MTPTIALTRAERTLFRKIRTINAKIPAPSARRCAGLRRHRFDSKISVNVRGSTTPM